MGKPRKYRVELRKNRGTRRRSGDLTRALDGNPDALADSAATERLSGKGELTRKRTIVEREPANQSATGTGTAVWRGRILQVHGLESQVQAGDGRIVRCTTSRVLRNLSSAERHPVVAGEEFVKLPARRKVLVIQDQLAPVAPVQAEFPPEVLLEGGE